MKIMIKLRVESSMGYCEICWCRLAWNSWEKTEPSCGWNHTKKLVPRMEAMLSIVYISMAAPWNTKSVETCCWQESMCQFPPACVSEQQIYRELNSRGHKVSRPFIWERQIIHWQLQSTAPNACFKATISDGFKEMVRREVITVLTALGWKKGCVQAAQ